MECTLQHRWFLLAALMGCEHSAPFRPGDYEPRGPFNSTPPVRLTFNPGVDERAAWLPDGSGIIYTFERTDRADDDGCLGILPAAGGPRLREICDRLPAADDSTDVFHSPAVAADGRIAYVRSSRPVYNDPGRLRFHQLVLATLNAPTQAQVLRDIPYGASDSANHEGISQVRWLDDTSLVFIGENWGCLASCPGPRYFSGYAVVRIDLRDLTAAPAVVPGTYYASSVAVVPGDTGVIYYTLDGDSRVFRRVLATGADSVVHDFGAAGIARDVQAVGRNLVAVLGGSVSSFVDSVAGPVQQDGGGDLYLVNLDTGQETVLGKGFYRLPSLSPDGRRVVVEAAGDLWLLEVP